AAQPRSPCTTLFRSDLDAALLVLDAVHAVRGGRHVVVDHGKRLLRMADLAAGHAQTFESLWAGHLMHEMAVDPQKAGSVFLAVNHVVVENLVVEGARCAHLRKSVELRMEKVRQAPVREADQPSRLVSAPQTRAKKRAGRRLRSCSTNFLYAGSPKSSSMRAQYQCFRVRAMIGAWPPRFWQASG